MPRRRRRRKFSLGRVMLIALAAIPVFYLLAALIGALLPVNRDWTEAEQGTTVYLRTNGVHIDLLMPAQAQGLDWRPLLPEHDFARPPPDPKWIAFGAGERRIYLETPRWRDLRPRAALAGLTGGDRIMHVERVAEPGTELRAIRLRPEEYRRLWAGVRASFDLGATGRPRRIDHAGYWHHDAFYEGVGSANAITTCNQWVADRLRIAGVRTSAWSPFAQGLLWRYRRVS